MEMEKLAALFEAVKVLPLRPDDYIVCKLPGRLGNDEIRSRVNEHLSRAFGGRKVIILEEGMDIEILRAEKSID